MEKYPSFSTSSNRHILFDKIKAYQAKIKTKINSSNPVITICYSTHRPEIIRLLDPIINAHNMVILEEPSVPEFKQLLDEKLSLDEYLELSDFTFPLFQSKLYKKIINMHKNRCLAVYQVDPYLETLLKIHEIFSQGGTASDLETSLQREIYETEKKVTDILLRYYDLILKGKFEKALEEIVRFAREDAARLRLRDGLRGRKICDILQKQTNFKVFIEAGYIHLWLFKSLKRLLPKDGSLIVFFPASPVTSFYLGKKQTYTPGDLLTLSFIFGIERRDKFLLAARSLIFTKILLKHEISPHNDLDFPHTLNEIECIRLVQKLSLEDCRKVFKAIRTAKSSTAKKIVEDFLEKHSCKS